MTLASISVWLRKTSKLQARHRHVRRVFHPATLSSGPESGLVNQIFALAGCAVFSKLLNATLVLPTFTSHDYKGIELPFNNLYNEAHFVDALRPAGVLAITREEYSVRRRASDAARRSTRGGEAGNADAALAELVSVFQGDQLFGWRLYKGLNRLIGSLSSNNVTRHREAEVDELRALERATFFGLRLSDSLEARVGALMSQLRLEPPFGCIHARVELDMVRSQVYNRAGPPPVLQDYFLSPTAAMRASQTVFVAVGTDITHADANRLNEPTPWGARMVLSPRVAKSAAHGSGNATRDSARSYTIDSLVDFELCRRSAWFAGWPGSTFARLLGTHQYLAGQMHESKCNYFAVCPASAGGIQCVRLSFRTLTGEHGLCTRM